MAISFKSYLLQMGLLDALYIVSNNDPVWQITAMEYLLFKNNIIKKNETKN